MLENLQNKIYLEVFDGKITRKVPEGTDGAAPRTNKNGTLVYEMHYRAVEGVLLDIGVYKHNMYGSQWRFTLQDGAETYCLQLSENTRALSSLLLALPSCDLKKPINIRPYEFTNEEGKSKAGVRLTQDGKKVEWFFTREDPKGLPDLKPITIEGKETFDSTARMSWLRQYVDEHIVPQLSGLPTPEAPEVEDLPKDMPF
jgi:hypothetical protein